MIKRIIAILIAMILFPLLVYAGSTRTAIFLIPKLQPEPHFNLIDPETGEERELTPKEQCQMQKYESLEANYTKIATIANKWILTGRYERVIGRYGPTYVKDGKEYQAYFINVKRIRNFDIVKAKAKDKIEKLNLDVIVGVTQDIQTWLSNRGFEQPTTEEMI